MSKIPRETMESLHGYFMRHDRIYRESVTRMEAKASIPPHIKRNIRADQIRIALSRFSLSLKAKEQASAKRL